MTRAILLGLAVLLAIDVLWLGLLMYWPSPANFRIAGYGGSFLAALITAYLAPHDRIFVGTMIALPAALFTKAVYVAFEATGGHVDSVGLSGGLIVFMFSLSIYTCICGVGGVLGSLLASLRSRIGRPRHTGLDRKSHEIRVD